MFAVILTVEIPELELALKVVDAFPLTVVAIRGLTVPKLSLAKVTTVPSGMLPWDDIFSHLNYV